MTKLVELFGLGIPCNQFPATTTSPKLIWRDPGLRGDLPILVAQLLASQNRKLDELFIGVGETQQVGIHRLPDTSPGSSKHCGIIHDLREAYK